MRKWMLLISCLSVILYIHAQNNYTYTVNKEGKIVVLPQKPDIDLSFPAYNYNSYTPPTKTAIENQLNNIVVPGAPRVADLPFSMQILSVAYRPYFNPFISMIYRSNPFALNFREVNNLPLNENLTLRTIGVKDLWVGMGGITRLNPSMVWSNGRLSISGGTFVTSYSTPFNISPEYMGGFNAHISYELSELIGLDAWGKYAIYDSDERKNPHMLMSPFYDHTNVGGAVRFNINEKFAIGAGLQYEYNPVVKRWDRQFLLFPIFK